MPPRSPSPKERGRPWSEHPDGFWPTCSHTPSEGPNMIRLLGTVSLLTLVGTAPAADQPPPRKELFGREDWYRGLQAREEVFEGVLEKVERGKGVPGFARFNPYRLVLPSGTREVYVGAQGHLLEPYIGQRVRLTGKAVDMEVEGMQHHEIWPARLEVLRPEKAHPGGR